GTSGVDISGLMPTAGAMGASVTIYGSGFGATQGTSTVAFNGTSATATSWSNTSIAATVPSGATTGPVVVTVNSTASNGVTFIVAAASSGPPTITGFTPSIVQAGSALTVNGTNFNTDPTLDRLTLNVGFSPVSTA